MHGMQRLRYAVAWYALEWYALSLGLPDRAAEPEGPSGSAARSGRPRLVCTSVVCTLLLNIEAHPLLSNILCHVQQPVGGIVN